VVLALEVQAEEVAMVVQEVDMEVQEWEAQEVDMELAVEREMVAALRKGRTVPLAASAAEAAVQAVGLFRM